MSVTRPYIYSIAKRNRFCLFSLKINVVQTKQKSCGSKWWGKKPKRETCLWFDLSNMKVSLRCYTFERTNKFRYLYIYLTTFYVARINILLVGSKFCCRLPMTKTNVGQYPYSKVAKSLETPKGLFEMKKFGETPSIIQVVMSTWFSKFCLSKKGIQC